MTVLHTFVNPIADEPGFLGTKPSDWNAVHVVDIVDADVNPAAGIVESKLALNFPTHAALTIGTANGLSLVAQVLSLGLSSSGVTGALSGTDWDTFNGKQSALTFPLAASLGGTGIANGASASLTLPNAATTITGGGTIALGGFTLTVPATGTAALLATANVFTAAQMIQGATTSVLPLTLKTTDDNTTNPLLRLASSAGASLVDFGATGLYTAYKSVGAGVTYYFTFGDSVGNNNQLGYSGENGFVNLVFNHVCSGATPARVRFRRNGTSFYEIASNSGIVTSLDYSIAAAGSSTVGFQIGYNAPSDYALALFYDANGSGRAFFSVRTGGSDGLQWRYDSSNTKIFAQVDLLGKHTWRALDTVTNAVSSQTISHQATTGTVAAGFGTGLAFVAETATNGTDQQQGLISTSWVDATNATRKAKLSLSAYDTAEKFGASFEADGSSTNAIATLGAGAGKIVLSAPSDVTLTVPATLTVAGLGIANVFTAAQTIDGTADAIQLHIQGHSTQTNPIFKLSKSDDTLLATVDNSGGWLVQTAVNTDNAFVVREIGGLATFYVNTRTRRLGIGTESPGMQFTLNASTGSEGGIRVQQNAQTLYGDTTTYLVLVGQSTVDNAKKIGAVMVDYAGTGAAGRIYVKTANTMYFEVGTYNQSPINQVMTLDINGLASHFGNTTTNNAVLEVMRFQSVVSTDSTGSANGFGVGQSFYAETATDGTYQQQGLISTSWIDATNASRKAKMSLSAYDTAARLGIEIEASGTAVKLGFFGVATVVRPTALTTQLTTVTFTAPGTPDYAIQDLVDSSAGAAFGFATKDEGNTVLSVIANLQMRVGELETKLQALGLLT